MGHLRRALTLGVVVASFAGLSAAADAASTPTWLCRPGASPNSCVTNLSAEKFSATGVSLGVVHPKASTHNAFDCFYVYPTISNEPTPVADLVIGPEQKSIVLYQASQYSQDCNVYAPVYRQVTLAVINGLPVTAAQQAEAYDDVAAAFKYYLAHYNKGRGFVLMGHSQGSFILRVLMAKLVDPSAKLRKQLISAVLVGGNVVIGDGPTGTGGDFKNIGVCRSAKQTGCVIGWSTFDQPVPPGALFGRPGTVGANQTPAGPNVKVLCSNPAALGGGSGLLTGYAPVQPFAAGLLSAGIALLGAKLPPTTQPFVESVGAYRAQCSNADDANVLEVQALGTSPVLTPSPTSGWGLHLADVNLPWATMVKVVASEGKAWLAAQPKAKTHRQ